VIAALVAFVVAALGATVAWHAMQQVFERPVFMRTNYRGHPLPTAMGVVIPLVTAASFALIELLFGGGWGGFARGRWFGLTSGLIDGAEMTALVAGFAFLGLLDDLGGVGESGGFRGHLRALAHGRLTTGAVKLFGGVALAIAVVGSRQGFGVGGEILDAAIVCLAANLANLLDRAPGRAVKCSLGALVLLTLLARDGRVVPPAVPIGAGAGLLAADLHEEAMLGDAGSNALGAACGFGAVLVISGGWRWVVAVVLLGLNVVSEVVSFSEVIDRVGPLRRLDRWGSPYRA
jgi:UDP-N-acetylmuramyl pentapeptide phosphotransferase/UDP-N-acetylglucosamine-1-phosphate transferase